MMLPFGSVRASTCTVVRCSLLERGIERALPRFGHRQQPAIDDHGAASVEIIAELVGDWRMRDADARGPRPRCADRCLETGRVALARHALAVALAEVAHGIRAERDEQRGLPKRSPVTAVAAGGQSSRHDGAEGEEPAAVDNVAADREWESCRRRRAAAELKEREHDRVGGLTWIRTTENSAATTPCQHRGARPWID